MKRLIYGVLFAVLTLSGFVLAQDQPSGHISGLMFGDYFYNVARDSNFNPGKVPPSTKATSGAKDLNGFNFRRIYFTYDNDISSDFSTRFRLEADQTDIGSNGKFDMFVKDAWLNWKKIYGATDLMFGLQPTFAFDRSEGWWAYRSLEKTIMDLRGVIPSRDMGLSLRGKINSDDMWGYGVMMADGAGNLPVVSKYKRLALNINIWPDKNFLIDLNADYQTRPDVNDPTSAAVPPATVSNSTLTTSVFVGYRQPDSWSAGLEAFMSNTMNGQKDSTSATTPLSLTSVKAEGVSLFGNVVLQSEWAIVARFDWFTPNSSPFGTSNTYNINSTARNLIIVGAAYKPTKNVQLIPNVEMETYSAPTNGTAPDASVTGRVTFFYSFM